jgi:hypothetical protein
MSIKEKAERAAVKPAKVAGVQAVDTFLTVDPADAQTFSTLVGATF